MRWLMASLAIVVFGIILFGPRRDVGASLGQPSFVMLALVTMCTAVAAAGAALVLSVPGAERTSAQRAVPIVLLAAWALLLVGWLLPAPAPMARILAFPVHILCIVQIAG